MAGRISLFIGIGAIVYLVALWAGHDVTTFNYTLVLTLLSPLLSLVCVAGLILGIVAQNKNRRTGVVDSTVPVAIFLNVVGVFGPFVVPTLLQFQF